MASLQDVGVTQVSTADAHLCCSPRGWHSRHSWECFFSCSPPLSMLYPIMLLALGFVQSQAYSMSTFKVSFKHQPKSDTQNAVFLIHPTIGKSTFALDGSGVLLMPFLQNWDPLKHAQITECSQRVSHLLLPKTFYFKAFHFEKQSHFLL